MRLFLILGVAVSLAACGHDDPGDGTSYNCAQETRDEEFVMGLTKAGAESRLEFKLVSSDPAPPSRGDNRWIVQLSTMAAPVTPVSGASMTVTPFMPDHQHGSGETVIVKPMTEAGQYELDPVNLWMPGLWEITMRVTGATEDRVVFRFCLAS
jgi:hypothetical protein